LLREFLDSAGKGQRAGFEKFFADDVIYTRSNGLVTNKADILKGVESLKPTEESQTRYWAEDLVIHDYGDTAVVAFRLVAETRHKDAQLEKTNYRNTGTFLRRHGVWQVVAWQSTKAATPTAETSR
jgi:ketosteroid isomerase-like protein